MVTYSIALYQTSQSEQNHGSEPLVRLEEYIQGAFGISGESVNTYIQSQTVPAPTEDPISGFTSMKPCDVSNQYYQNLTEWFKEWLSWLCSFGTRRLISRISHAPTEIVDGGFEQHLTELKPPASRTHGSAERALD